MAEMSHDISSRACATMHFWKWRPDVEHESRRWDALSTYFIGGRSLAARLRVAMLGDYFAPKFLRPFYDLLRTKKPTTVFVIRTRLEAHVGSRPD